MGLMLLVYFEIFRVLAGPILGQLDYFDALNSIKKAPVVVVTVASDAKVHGHHLPLNTDVILAQRIADDLAAQTEAAVYPNVSIGWYPQFAKFKLVNYSAETAQAVIYETLSGLLSSGAKKILILNFDSAHTSGSPIMIAMNKLAQEHPTPMVLLSWYDFVDEKVVSHLSGNPGHADELETSLMLHLDESNVEKSKLRDVPAVSPLFHLYGFVPIVFDLENQKTSLSIPGQIGNSRLSSKSKGSLLYDQILENIKKNLKSLAAVKAQRN